MTRTERHRPSSAAVMLGAMVLMAIGGALGLVLAPEAEPASLVAAPDATSAPVTYESYDDQRELPFELVPGASDTVTLPRAGTVTTLECDIGAPLKSGDVPLSLDSAPVVALYTAYPLWRDLRPGDGGPDVAALQSELTRLGYAPSTSAAMDSKTVSALKAFFRDRGYTSPSGSLDRDSVLWLPSERLTVAQCPIRRGEFVSAGGPALQTGGGLAALRLVSTSDALAPGARIVSFNGSSAPVGDDGVVVDPTILASIAASPEYVVATSQTGGSSIPQITLTSTLATPLHTAVVPAGALYGVSGSSGCVSSGGVGQRVTIVSSRLGSTYVVLDGGAEPASVDLHAPDDRTRAVGPCS